MLTLKEHNDLIVQRDRALRDMRKAGVKCDCGAELVYADDFVLPTNPAQQRVRCPSCGFSGFKLG